ncbi:hypothetical protein GF380_05210 [Candidatus Uhrbacteria bacterium]|nr:hypothetical protein [Candidatus Uhrbacteria bacterium]
MQGKGSNKMVSNPIKQLASNFALITIVIAIWAAFQYVTGWNIPSPWDALETRRAVGPFPFPNAIALFVAPVVALLAADQLNGKEKRLLNPYLGWITTASGILAMILAKSDGGLLAVAAAVFVVLVMKRKTRIPTLIITATLAALIFAIPQTRTPAIQMITFSEWSGKVRLVMWGETTTMLRDHPIFGAGLGGYPATIEPYHEAEWMEIFQYPHNVFLNLWSEVGLLGIVIFGWILWKWIWDSGFRIRPGRKNDPKSQTLNPTLAIAIVTAILVHGLVDVPYFKNDLAIAFWLLILLTTQIPKRIEKQRNPA